MLRSTLACLAATLMIGLAPAASAQAPQNAAPPARQEVRGNLRTARPDRHVAPTGRRRSLSGRQRAVHASRHARFARRARFTARRRFRAHARAHAQAHARAHARARAQRHARFRSPRHAALRRQMRIRHARRRRNVRYF